MLWRALNSVTDGFYIDIGAQDPLVDSVSRLFYEHGWRGVHVEPTSTYAEALRKDRPDETVIQAVVSDETGLVLFHEIPGTGISTGVDSIAESHQRSGNWTITDVVEPAITLASVFEFAKGRDIHWLKIDVEGYEQRVLHSWGDHSARPWILVVESILPVTRTVVRNQWEHEVLDRGYKLAYFDGLNSFYVHDAYPELLDAFKAPPNVFDGFVLSGLGSSSFHSDIEARVAAEHAGFDSIRNVIEKEGKALEVQRRAEFDQLNGELVSSKLQNAYLRDELLEMREQLLAVERERAKSETLLEIRTHQVHQDILELRTKIEEVKSNFNYTTHRKILERVFFRSDGRPIRPLRRLFFHTSGKPRGIFRRLVLHKDGTPRRVFSRWMSGKDYLSLRCAVKPLLQEGAGVPLCVREDAILNQLSASCSAARSQPAGPDREEHARVGESVARSGTATDGYQSRFWLKRIAARSNGSREPRF